MTVYRHITRDARGRLKEFKSYIFEYMSQLYLEAVCNERFNVDSMFSATSLSLYKSFTETMPPAAVELKYPERDFNLIWKRVGSNVLTNNGRTILYLIIHERS